MWKWLWAWISESDGDTVSPSCDHTYEERLVPFIPRFGWNGIDHVCTGCGHMREDSFSAALAAESEWSCIDC